jgi:hypothetical protein
MVETAFTPVDYKAIVRKMSSGEALNDAEKGAVFGVALKYAHSLVEAKAGVLFGLSQKSQEIKNYLDLVTLSRLVNLYERATRYNETVSEVVTMFGQLKNSICKDIAPEINSSLDEPLKNFLNEELDIRLDPSPEVANDIRFIQESGSKIVA